jgi:uncharacterized surface protein with fasciclin (FAS1) repeats
MSSISSSFRRRRMSRGHRSLRNEIKEENREMLSQVGEVSQDNTVLQNIQLIPELSILATDLPVFPGLNALLAACNTTSNVTLFAPTDQAIMDAVEYGKERKRKKKKRNRKKRDIYKE